ncbi:MAG: AAA family ATPase, partial [Bacteroidetes bacterium]|nr:AAA family ATPase [Bacteroidota bacterium]
DGDVAAYVDDAQRRVIDLTSEQQRGTLEHVQPILVRDLQAISDAAGRGDSITGISTGLSDFDTKTAGLHRGDLMIVAARPGMGKSALARRIAVHVASPKPAADGAFTPGSEADVFSCEMPKEQVARAAACSEARIDLSKLRTATMTPDDWVRLQSAARDLSQMPLMIDDTAGLTLAELRAKVRRRQGECHRRHQKEPSYPDNVGLVVVDYLQLMRDPTGARGSREQEVSAISRGLKQIAKDLDVPVVALAQLNRGVESRGAKDKRPNLADLRESGSIEQDSDTVVFIYRDEYYNGDSSDERGVAELIIAKQRNGPTGTVRVRWIGHCTRFENLAPGEYDAPDWGF